MNADIRISVGFPNHPKTVKLERRLGFQGIRSLLALWTWAAQNRPDGNRGGANVVSGVRSNEGSTAAKRREPDVGLNSRPVRRREAPTNEVMMTVQLKAISKTRRLTPGSSDCLRGIGGRFAEGAADEKLS